MRYGMALAASLVLAATPAFATGGFACKTTGKDPIMVNIVTGRGVGPVLAEVAISEAGTVWSTARGQHRLTIVQSWIDDREVRIDLADPNIQRYEARLRLPRINGIRAEGTLERRGRIMAIRCIGEQ